MKENFPNILIEVCDSCLTASYWHGEFMCDKAKSAGTKLLTVATLRQFGYENPQYWSDETQLRVYGSKAPHGYSP